MSHAQNQYSNGKITVTYKPRKCINAARCARELSSVFNTTVLPWINLDAAPCEQIENQISKCPSGALSCVRSN